MLVEIWAKDILLSRGNIIEIVLYIFTSLGEFPVFVFRLQNI